MIDDVIKQLKEGNKIQCTLIRQSDPRVYVLIWGNVATLHEQDGKMYLRYHKDINEVSNVNDIKSIINGYTRNKN